MVQLNSLPTRRKKLKNSKTSINFLLLDKDGKVVYRKWKEAAYDDQVFMTIFDEDLTIREGDVLIGEMHVDSSSLS